MWSVQFQGRLLGPYDVTEVRGLAKAGVISADTLLVHSDGRKVSAGQLRGMTFGVAQDVEPPPPLTQLPRPPVVPATQIEDRHRWPSTFTDRRWFLVALVLIVQQVFATIMRERRENAAKKQSDEEIRKLPFKVTDARSTPTDSM